MFLMHKIVSTDYIEVKMEFLFLKGARLDDIFSYFMEKTEWTSQLIKSSQLFFVHIGMDKFSTRASERYDDYLQRMQKHIVANFDKKVTW